MGQSTDAILSFGINNTSDDESTIYPWANLFADIKRNEHEDEDSPPYLRTGLIDIVQHCSCDYPMYIIAIRSTVKTAWRGQVVTVENLDVDPDELQQFIEWCRGRGIEEDPKWFLVSNWC